MSKANVALVMVVAVALGQSWVPQTSGTINTLNAVWFTSPQVGFIAGDGGVSLRTADGGSTWTPFNLTNEDLEDVAFSGASSGLMVGDNGSVFYTTDGGAGFSPAGSGTSSNLRAAAMGENGMAYAAGRDGVVLKSTNGGASWQVVETGSVQWDGLWAWGDRHAWVVGEQGNIKRTTDGGASWQSVSSGTGSDLKNVFFIDASNGWAVGQNSTVIRSTDGGASWSPSSSGVNFGMDGVHFISPTEGWVVGNSGAVYHSNNTGAAWQLEASGTANELEDVFFYAGIRGWAVGDGGTIISRQLAGIEDRSRVGAERLGARVYPNPVSGRTRISFVAPRPGPASVVVSDAGGRQVRALLQNRTATGSQELSWDRTNDSGSAVAAGVYFCDVRVGSLNFRMPVVVVGK